MAAEKWNLDTVHSGIGFTVRHLMVTKVHGRFGKWSGTFEFDEQNPAASKVEVAIDAASVDSQEPKRDAHLRSPDFLDVEKYPQLTFKSTSVTGAGEELVVKGDLTIHGVTRPVVLEVEYAGRIKDTWGGERAGFSAKTSISRKEFGLTWNQALETGGVMVSDKVEISIDLQAVRAQAAATKAA
jgi:polyisoprenoid-binding protein YceI